MNIGKMTAILSAVMSFPLGIEGCAMPSSPEAVPSVSSVANSDQWITSRVKNALIAEEGVSASTIRVESESGHVTLEGRVRSRDERARAVEVARSIAGVTDVTANLEVEKRG